jgi:hypothetical protein
LFGGFRKKKTQSPVGKFEAMLSGGCLLYCLRITQLFRHTLGDHQHQKRDFFLGIISTEIPQETLTAIGIFAYLNTKPKGHSISLWWRMSDIWVEFPFLYYRITNVYFGVMAKISLPERDQFKKSRERSLVDASSISE